MQSLVVIDTDGGVDDALALLLALNSPELKVEAITTTCGNVPVEQATRNIFLLLELLGASSQPLVALGASSPMTRPLVTAQNIHGSDGLGELSRYTREDGTRIYPERELPSRLPDATKTLLEIIERHPPGRLTLITLGPLTNLASALQASPHTIKRLGEVIVMGGAIRTAGNCTPAAEFNMRTDPQAAALVFQSGLSITLVPLDVTERVLLGRTALQMLSEKVKPPVGPFLVHAASRALEFMEERYGIEGIHLHDPLTVGVAIDSSLIKPLPLHVEVETEGRFTEGMTVADLRPLRDRFKSPPNLKAALDVDVEKFLSLFEERLCQGSL